MENSKTPMIKNKTQIILELGCGESKKNKNAIGIDIRSSNCVDIVANMKNGIPFIISNSVDVIYTYHFFEHVAEPDILIIDIYRALKTNGILSGSVPHFSNPFYYSDPTHKSFFGLYSFSYFSEVKYFNREVPNYFNINFKIEDISIFFDFYPKCISKLFNIMINVNKTNKELYEKYLTNFFPAYEIRFTLKKI